MLKSKKYDEAIIIMKEKEKLEGLKTIEIYIMKLINKLLDIEKNGIIPEINLTETDNIFTAIDENNFELAYKLNQEYLDKFKIDSKNNIINILLTEICLLINKNKKKILEKTKVSLTDIINNLLKNDIDNAYKIIEEYMDIIDKSEYTNLITNLIKLSLLKNDKAFSLPITTLIYISKDEYNFDIKEFIEKFYIALSENKLDEARIYLDIMHNSNNISKENILTEELLKVFEETEKMVNKKQDLNNQMTKEEIIKPNCNEVKSDAPKSNLKIKDNDEKFIEDKHEILVKEQGVILLKPMPKERRKHIHNIVKKYKDMKSFSIGEESERQIVLIYSPYIEEYIDIKQEMQKARTETESRNYKDAIEIYLKLLQKYKNPTSYIFASIGLNYLNNSQKNKAIDYLIIATKINIPKNKYNFTELIAKLKGEILEEENKPFFKMSLDDFEDNIENQAMNFDEIINYIEENNTDLRNACIHLNMSEEQIDLTTLIFAKKYYLQGAKEKAEEFLKVFEKSENKTLTTINFYNDIIKNRKIYMNRDYDFEEPRLSLIIKPQNKTIAK